MKIRALTAVRDGKKYFAPGDEWDCRKNLADKLISWGGAVKVLKREPEPEVETDLPLDLEAE